MCNLPIEKQMTSFERHMRKKIIEWHISENDRLNLIFLINEVLRYYSAEYEDDFLSDISRLLVELENLPLAVRTDRADRPGHSMDVYPETGEVIERPTESLEKAPLSDLPKLDDALRIEVITEACRCITVSQNSESPSWCGATREEWKELYDSASSDSEKECNPDEDLPF